MKLNAKTGLIVVAVIAAGFFLNLWMDRNRQVEKLEQLRNELSVTVTRLNTLQSEELSVRQEELQSQLSQAVAEIEVAKAELSQPISSIAVSGTLFDTAEAAGVEIIEITSSKAASDTIEGITCSTLQLNITIEGDIADILRFVEGLQSAFPTGLVRSVDVDIPCAAKQEETSAVIKLDIFSYEGE